jgi:hypothetical protein
MIGGTANIFTKVGNDTTVAIMLAGYANIFTHVGDGFKPVANMSKDISGSNHSRQSDAVADFSKDIGCPAAYH